MPVMMMDTSDNEVKEKTQKSKKAKGNSGAGNHKILDFFKPPVKEGAKQKSLLQFFSKPAASKQPENKSEECIHVDKENVEAGPKTCISCEETDTLVSVEEILDDDDDREESNKCEPDGKELTGKDQSADSVIILSDTSCDASAIINVDVCKDEGSKPKLDTKNGGNGERKNVCEVVKSGVKDTVDGIQKPIEIEVNDLEKVSEKVNLNSSKLCDEDHDERANHMMTDPHKEDDSSPVCDKVTDNFKVPGIVKKVSSGLKSVANDVSSINNECLSRNSSVSDEVQLKNALSGREMMSLLKEVQEPDIKESKKKKKHKHKHKKKDMEKEHCQNSRGDSSKKKSKFDEIRNGEDIATSDTELGHSVLEVKSSGDSSEGSPETNSTALGKEQNVDKNETEVRNNSTKLEKKSKLCKRKEIQQNKTDKNELDNNELVVRNSSTKLSKKSKLCKRKETQQNKNEIGSKDKMEKISSDSTVVKSEQSCEMSYADFLEKMEKNVSEGEAESENLESNGGEGKSVENDSKDDIVEIKDLESVNRQSLDTEDSSAQRSGDSCSIKSSQSGIARFFTSPGKKVKLPKAQDVDASDSEVKKNVNKSNKKGVGRKSKLKKSVSSETETQHVIEVDKNKPQPDDAAVVAAKADMEKLKQNFLNESNKAVSVVNTKQATLSFGASGLTMAKPAVLSNHSVSSPKGKSKKPKVSKVKQPDTADIVDLNDTANEIHDETDGTEEDMSEDCAARRRSTRKKYQVSGFQLDVDKMTPIKIKLKRCPKKESNSEDIESLDNKSAKKELKIAKQSKALALLEKAKKAKQKKKAKHKDRAEKQNPSLDENGGSGKEKHKRHKKKSRKPSERSTDSDSGNTRRSSRLVGKSMASMEEVSLENIVISSDEEQPVRKKGKRKSVVEEAKLKDVKKETPKKGTPRKGTPKKQTSDKDTARSPSKKAGVKLAPMFLMGKKCEKASPKKPVLDPELVRQRQEFLMSGVPDELKKQTATRIAATPVADFPPLPKINHVQQRPELDGVAGDVRSSRVHTWNLGPVQLKLRDQSELVRRDQSELATIKPVSTFTGGLICTQQARVDMQNIKGFTGHKVLEDSVLGDCQGEVSSCNASYSVQRMYKALKRASRQPTDEAAGEKVSSKDAVPEVVVIDEDEVPKRRRRGRSLKLTKMSAQTEPKETDSVVDNKSNYTGSCLLWTDKYQPMHSSEVLGNSGVLKKLRSWLTEWKHVLDREARKARKLLLKKNKGKQLQDNKDDNDMWDDDSDFDLSSDDSEEDDSLCNTMLLSGPHGCGKTSSVYALALEVGFKVVVGSPKGGGGKKQWKKSNQALGIKTTIQEILRQKKKQKTLECFVADYEWAVRCIAGDGSSDEGVQSDSSESEQQRDNDHGNIDTNFDNQGEAATFSDNEDVLSNLCKSQQQPDNDHGNIDTNVDDQGESDTFSDNEDARSNLCESQQERDDDHGNIDTNFDDQGESDTFSDNEDARSNLCESQKQRDNDHGNIDTNFDDQGESDTFSDNEDARSNLCESQKQRDNDHGNIDTNFDDQGESDTFSDNEDARSNLCESQKQRDNDHGNIDTNFDDQGESDTFSDNEDARSNLCESQKQRDNDHGNIDTNFDDQGESDTFSDNEDARSNLCKIQQQPDNDHGNIDTNVDDQGESDTFSDNEDVLSNLCKSQKQRDNDHGNIDTNFDDQGESDTFSDNEDVRSNLCKSQKQRDNDHGNIDTNFDDQGESDTFSDNEDVRSNLSHSQQENVNDHGNIDTNWDDQGKSDPSESQQLFDIPSLQRDINQPGIYIRKLTKSCKSSKAQASVKKVGNNRVYDNYHSCLFCGEMRQHIKLHLETHKHITEVKQLLANENPDIVRIRKLGDHKHNKKVIKHGKGQIILSRRPETDLDITRYGPCIICKEWVLLKNLKRHVTKCSGRRITVSKRHLIIQSQVEAGLISKSPSKLMLKEVFPCMRMDDIGQLAKSDTLIIALGESWLRRSIDNREKRKYYASQHMRLMAKLLIQIRKLDTSSANKELAEYLVPQHFDLIVAAALECCVPFMDDVEELQSPSNGIKIKYDLQRVLTARWAMLVKEDPHSVLAKEVQTCQELMKIEWADKIVKLSRTVLARRSLGMRKELPAPEDILKLTQFITEELKTTALSAENYTKIVKLAQTRLLVYNKRRSGELEAIRLENYAGKTRDIDEMDQSLIDDLTKVELHLLKSQELMQVRGKGNRPVPVLIPADAIKPLDYIASRTARREAGIPESNVYLFPNSGQSHARAYSSLKCLCDQCLLTYPGRITSVSMRKYTATLTQMLNLNPNQIDWVCKHLGHSSDVHKAHYRQMSGLIERVYVTKLLLLQDLNLTKKFKGQSLDEIDISDIVFPDGASIDRDFPDGASIDRNGTDTLLDNVVEDVAQTERDDEPVDRVVFEDSEDDGEDEDEFEDEAPPPKKIQKKVVRQRWDETEMKEIHEYFKLYLDSKITPRSHEVNSAKKKSKSNGGRIWLRTTDKIVKKISAMNHRK